jgi:hypothetical protein
MVNSVQERCHFRFSAGSPSSDVCPINELARFGGFSYLNIIRSIFKRRKRQRQSLDHAIDKAPTGVIMAIVDLLA